jgi:polysaccharide biosynthesis transport protein
MMVRRWWWILVLFPVVFGLAAYLLSTQMTPIYEAEATLILEHEITGSTPNFESILAAERRTRTFSQLATSQRVLQPAIDALGLQMTANELRSQVSISHTRETQLLSITVRDPNPERAAALANAISEHFASFVEEIQAPAIGRLDTDLPDAIASLEDRMEAIQERIVEIENAGTAATQTDQQELFQMRELNDRLEAAHATLLLVEQTIDDAQQRLGSRVTLAEPAEPPVTPSSPILLLNVALAVILGTLLGTGAIVVLGYRDDKIRTADDVARLTDHPVLASVPRTVIPEHVEELHSGQSIAGDIFQGLRTSLSFAMYGMKGKTLVVTSSRQSEGKSVVAANLAIALAESGQRVVLVDGDLRRPRLHSMFEGVSVRRGLTNIILDEAADVRSFMQPTNTENLEVISSGFLPPNPSVLLSSPRMRQIVDELEQYADVIVMDSPPTPLPDALIIASLAAGVLFVIRAEQAGTQELVGNLQTISQTNTQILGIVLNGVNPSAQPGLRVYERYYSESGDGDRQSASQPKRARVRRILFRKA